MKKKIGIVGLVCQFVEKNQKSEMYRQVESDAWNKKGEGRRASEVTENRKMGSMGLDRFAAQRSGLMEMLKGRVRACTCCSAQWQVGGIPGSRCNFWGGRALSC